MHSNHEVSARAESVIEGVDRMQLLPEVILRQTQAIAGESESQQLALVSKTMHSIFQPANQVFNKFLQCVAFGQQDKAERLFRVIYSGNPVKVQEALVHQGEFTDYSGRTFNCSAYEYAYWAKDTHMCRMLERYMDEETKALILARINVIEAEGLSYQQNGEKHRSKHFDLTPLKEAYQAYIDGYAAAWMAIGMAQHDVPAHVAQEYCNTFRAFDPRPEFNDAFFPRSLTFYNLTTQRDESWFGILSANSGPDSQLTIFRGRYNIAAWRSGPNPNSPIGPLIDLAAITRLDEVRTADLALSREHLTPSASLPGLSA